MWGGFVRSGRDGTGRPGFCAAACGRRWVEDLSGWEDAPAPAQVGKRSQVASPTRSGPGLIGRGGWGAVKCLDLGLLVHAQAQSRLPAGPVWLADSDAKV
jgi:hypothetical protein